MRGVGVSTGSRLLARKPTARVTAPRMIPASNVRLPVEATPGADKGSMGPLH